ncbi:MAG TPA: alpha/beta hydrolase [Ohtaekwangia sp.]|nr:alpha/beta hydrolase [Ohtaekwangia sp.]
MVTSFNGSRLHYFKKGDGPIPILLFHGFGQTHQVYAAVAEALSTTCTCYTFDLYFHGESTWGHGEQPLEKAVWKKVMEQFLAENNIDRFALLGFSLGAKFALATLECFPDKASSVFLVAPDGIKTSFWYSLATYPLLLRKYFRSIVTHPKRFFFLARLFRGAGLISKGLYRFATHQMSTETERRRVYYSWIVFRHLAFDLKVLGDLVNRFHIPLAVFTGRYDKVIRTENMKRLKQYAQHTELHILSGGHNGLLSDDALIRTVQTCLNRLVTDPQNDNRG